MSIVAGLKYKTLDGQSFDVFRGSECGYYYTNEKGARRYISKEKLQSMKRDMRQEGMTWEPVQPCRKGKSKGVKRSQSEQRIESTDTDPFADGYKAYLTVYPAASASAWSSLTKDNKIAWLEAYLMKNGPGLVGQSLQFLGLSTDQWKYLEEKEGISPLRGVVLKGFDWWVSKSRELNFADFSKDIKWQDLTLERLVEDIKDWNAMRPQERNNWILQGDWDDTVAMMKNEPGFVNFVNMEAQMSGLSTFDEYLAKIEQELHNTSTNSRSNSKPSLLHLWDVFKNQMTDQQREKYIEMKSDIPEAPPVTPITTPDGTVLAVVDDQGDVKRVDGKGTSKVNVANAIVVAADDPLKAVIKEAPKATTTDLSELKEAQAAFELRALYKTTCQQQGKVWDPKTGLCVDVVTAGSAEDLKRGFYHQICPPGQILKKGVCVGIKESGIKINIPEGDLKREIENFNKSRLRKVSPALPKSVQDAVLSSPIMEKRLKSGHKLLWS